MGLVSDTWIASSNNNSRPSQRQWRLRRGGEGLGLWWTVKLLPDQVPFPAAALWKGDSGLPAPLIFPDSLESEFLCKI